MNIHEPLSSLQHEHTHLYLCIEQQNINRKITHKWGVHFSFLIKWHQSHSAHIIDHLWYPGTPEHTGPLMNCSITRGSGPTHSGLTTHLLVSSFESVCVNDPKHYWKCGSWTVLSLLVLFFRRKTTRANSPTLRWIFPRGLLALPTEPRVVTLVKLSTLRLGSMWALMSEMIRCTRV